MLNEIFHFSFTIYRVERHVIIYVLCFSLITAPPMWWSINNNFYWKQQVTNFIFHDYSHNIPSFQIIFKNLENKKKKKLIILFMFQFISRWWLSDNTKNKKEWLSPLIYYWCVSGEIETRIGNILRLFFAGNKNWELVRRIAFTIGENKECCGSASVIYIFLSFRWCLPVSWFVHGKSPSFPCCWWRWYI